MPDRIAIWRFLRKPEDKTIEGIINRHGYGLSYVENLVLHLWVTFAVTPAFDPLGTITPYVDLLKMQNILCKCVDQYLWNKTVAIDVEPFTNGTLIVTQYPRQCDAEFVRPNFVR